MARFKELFNKNFMNISIVKTHIENDVVNSSPTIVFTDENGIEWVHEEQTSQYAGYMTMLVEKSKSWFFKKENQTDSSLSKEEGKDEVFRKGFQGLTEVVLKQHQEITRLKGLLKKEWLKARPFATEDGWQQFAKENGLKEEEE